MKITRFRPSRAVKIQPDKFTSWLDEDGIERQGFLHHTGLEVFYHGSWIPQYEYQDGPYPEIAI